MVWAPGDYNLFQKMFGATSNNAARLSARAYGRALSVETYNAAKAEENKVRHQASFLPTSRPTVIGHAAPET